MSVPNSVLDYFDDGMILDCSTISISYAVNGIATISFTTYTKYDVSPFSGSSEGFDMVIGGVRFKGYIMSMDLSPSVDSDYDEWKVTAVTTGSK